MPTDTPRKERSLFRSLGMFLLVLLVAGGGGFGIFRLAVSSDDSAELKRAKTFLDQRIATAREIREVLSRPQPPIEPLPPRTAKLANPAPEPAKVVGMDNNKPVRLPKEARDAFASEPRSLSDTYDRPTYHRGTYDRAVGGGF